MLAVKIVQVRRLPRDSLSLGEAKKVFILVSFCIVERPFIEEASDTASLKSSRRVLCAEVCHAPIKDVIFWWASPWKHALGKTGFRIHVLRHLIGKFESAGV